MGRLTGAMATLESDLEAKEREARRLKKLEQQGQRDKQQQQQLPWGPSGGARGRAVQVEPMKRMLKAPGTKRLKL